MALVSAQIEFRIYPGNVQQQDVLDGGYHVTGLKPFIG